VNTAFRSKELKQTCLLLDFDEQAHSMGLYSGYEWEENELQWSDGEGVTLAIGRTNANIQCNWSVFGNVLFDCPPSITSADNFIRFLQNHNLNIDVWVIPVESRTSIMGAGTISKVIKSAFPDTRVVLVGNRFNSSALTQSDRAEMARLPFVELYKQVIPQGQEITKFEQQGGKPVWEHYKGKQWTVRMRDFCEWLLRGASHRETFVNTENQTMDKHREIFVTSKTSRKREYGKF